MNPSTKRKRHHKKTVPDLLTQIAHELQALKILIAAPAPYVFRGDRAAAHFVGMKSPWRFSDWATKRGLKPLIKVRSRERTIYRVRDLVAACEADIQRQKEGPP